MSHPVGQFDEQRKLVLDWERILQRLREDQIDLKQDEKPTFIRVRDHSDSNASTSSSESTNSIDLTQVENPTFLLDSAKKTLSLTMKIFISVGMITSHSLSLAIMGFGLFHILTASSLIAITLWTLGSPAAVITHKISSGFFSRYYKIFGELFWKRGEIIHAMNTWHIDYLHFKYTPLERIFVINMFC